MLSAYVSISEGVLFFGISEVYMLYHIGERTAPCGTPVDISFVAYVSFLIFTCYVYIGH